MIQTIIEDAPKYGLAAYFIGTGLNALLKLAGFGASPISQWLDRVTFALEGLVGAGKVSPVKPPRGGAS